MLNEKFEFINNTFTSYYGDGKFFVLFLISILFLFIEEKDKKKRSFLIYFPLLFLAIFWCPFFIIVLSKLISESVYYRFLWGIPIGIIIAYSGVKFLARIEKKVIKDISFLILIVIIIYSGNSIYTETTFEKVNNTYKLPDEYVKIIEVMQEIPIDNKKAMVPTELIGYVRQLDASIKLAYSRRAYGDYEENFEIVRAYNSGNVERVLDECKNQGVNILVHNINIPLDSSFDEYGCDLIERVQNYNIYVLVE